MTGARAFGVLFRKANRAKTAEGKISSPTLLSTYFKAIALVPRAAAATLFFFVSCGIFQGLAFLCLAPVLKLAMREASSGIAATAIAKMGTLGLSRTGIMVLGTAGFVGLAALAAVLKYKASLEATIFRTQLENRLREKITRGLFEMSWNAYVKYGAGVALKDLFEGCWRYALGAEHILQAIGFLAVALAMLAMAGAMMPVETGLSLIFLFACMLGLRLYHARRAPRSGALVQLSNTYSDLAGQVLGQLRFVRSTGISRRVEEMLASRFERLHRDIFDLITRDHRVQLSTELAVVIVIGAGLSHGVFYRQDHLGEFAVFLGLFYRAIPLLMVIQRHYDSSKHVHYSAESWRQLHALMVASSRQEAGRTPPPDAFKRISFERVSHRYEEQAASEWVLRDASFEIRAGECVVLYGPSGSGKSTTLELLTGLIRPISGRVAIDELDLENLDIEAWRAKIGLVPQDIYLGNESIAACISWGDREPNEARVLAAAKTAQVLEFAKTMPGEMEATVGDGGQLLSGGQRQRVALARALYREPQILLLDEPTSALDPSNARRIVEAIAALKGKLTTVIITHSHDFDTVADRMLIVDQGKILSRPSP